MSENKDNTKTFDPQQLQLKFERWHELYREQLMAQNMWLEAEQLFNELTDYYQSEQWMRDRENNTQLNYSGNEYSILSEDALWNMISNRNDLAVKWMRLGLTAIEQK